MKKRLLALLMAMALCVGLAACGQKDPDPTPEAGGTLTAGTYTASKLGMNGQVKVEVVVDETTIQSVKVLENQETPGIGSPLVDGEQEGTIPTLSIPKAIVDNQTVNVDAVAGATITSATIKAAVEDCLTQAGADLANWKTPVEKNGTAITKDADVIVVGGGGAGLAAAISAAAEGATVIVVEKNGAVGGDTLVCGAIYNNPDPALQAKVTMTDAVKTTIENALQVTPVNEEHKALIDEVAKEWADYKASGRTDLFDSEAWFTLQTFNGGDCMAELPLVKEMTYNAIAGYEWIQGLGMEFNDVIGQGAGALWQRTHTSTKQMGTGFISTYVENNAKNDKVEIITSTTVTELVKDAEGKVVGAKGQDVNGNTYTFNAAKGVVLATGGFAANGKMVEENKDAEKWTVDLSKMPTTNRWSCSQGDGLAMATAVGAQLTDMDLVQLLYLGNLKDGGLTKYPPRVVNGTDQEIFINKNGERFVNEGGRRDEICLAVLQQPDAMFYFLESADGDYVDVKSAITADGFTFQQMEEEGYIIVADTLEEMATKLGCDAATLKATVDAFNASVDSGEDAYGRTLFTTKLENGPFVATPRQACVHHTMGGVKIDTECRVLDADGNVIPGLVAAGEVTGGIHGGNRLGGNAVVDTVVFGKLAGETIAK